MCVVVVAVVAAMIVGRLVRSHGVVVVAGALCLSVGHWVEYLRAASYTARDVGHRLARLSARPRSNSS